MPNDPFPIRTDPRELRPPRPKRRALTPLLIGAITAAVIAMALAAIVITTQGDSTTASNEPEAPARVPTHSAEGTPTADASEPPPNSPAPAKEQIVEDPQGELLWASPTTGPQLSLAYVPAGTQCLIHLRPALIAIHPEGERILSSLGPWGQRTLRLLRDRLAAEAAEIDSLLVSVVVMPSGELDACLRAKLRSDPADAGAHVELGRRFPDAQAARQDAKAYYKRGDRAIIPTSANEFVVCPITLAPELIDSAGEPPPLVRDIEALAAQADADRAATIIVATKLLQAGGNELLTAEAAPLHEAIRRLAGNEATAIALSAHLDENFFVELRAAPALSTPPRRLSAILKGRLVAAPDELEERVLASNWPPYGRKVIARLPAMFRALVRYTRTGEDARQTLLRAYLPTVAAHNLLTGAELLLTQPPGESASADGLGATNAAAPEQPKTIEQRLAAKTSLVFTKDSLQRALELLSEDTGIDIQIAGADLQQEGITKNQSLALDLRDRPVAEILLEVLLRANPDRTAAGPADPKQKLVYVVQPDTADGPARIIVTTRTAAEKRGDSLPAPFNNKSR